MTPHSPLVPGLRPVPPARPRRGERGRWTTTAVDGRSELSPRRAREYVRRVCGRWRVPAAQAENAVLIVSELVTNAVVHGVGDRVTVVVTLTGRDRLTVSVTDRGPEAGGEAGEDGSGGTPPPPPDEPCPAAEGGRGLWLVSVLATEVGCEPVTGVGRGTGTRIWARIDPPEAACGA
ncbi:hypothetical protein CUT44_15345 [Streptomyces carminius]|uniref:Histidine kinase/HSP90-like ATPase domain-containing protein n=1 Tax=Streptomyces carminius TaxID=2665496 RepID=A0A2M8LYC1_9ACTN|nr:ATP-binding protein [Streptomyces carminius]PJE96929.1 hypothetical protein CUT44_15345 [Streptomyces carminius]